MNKIIYCLVLFLSVQLSLNAQVKTVILGKQIWTSKNMEVDKFRDGTVIPQAMTPKDWQIAADEKKPAWCYYDNDPANGEKYGKLYNWYAVADARGLCPAGFHAPSDSEWTMLIDFLGGKDSAGKKLKSKSGWRDNGNGNNESGMKGKPGGFRNSQGVFAFVGELGAFWTGTEASNGRIWDRGLTFRVEGVTRFEASGGVGMSVRCLKD